ncbi:hypothetical protein NPX13_g6148 [Xylaria arbuscula]|uniref:Heterokaryon incompatibility domain-containing protein n=1 Tax=Xylaria arbuscula TaxID=114810 RepID=A0A9W8ND67_9PEZI|nr:hypothetical protein NPX13_g6148 [Xylaria arbuscula]
MHLLNVDTRRLEEFWGDRTPPYAILSHTWGEEEVSFQDLDDPKHKEKLGYAKIEGCCQQAIRDGLNFIWVDTCCIDKRSSAELSEAINSMFRWYGEAQVCYVYLEDVPLEENVCAPNSAFCRSRWFTRGWTLQELIAPVELKFFDKTWGMIFVVNKCKKTENGSYLSGDISGTRVAAVARITGIESWHSYWSLTHDICNDLRGVPLATKLSWISKRSTRRVEDMAYSLLGLLEVSMPLLYGEGDGAFIRLQEEFLKKYFDPSILLWGIGMDRLAIKEFGGHLKPYGLARTPLLFAWARGVLLLQSGKHLGQPSRGIWALTPHGLRVELPLLRIDACSDAYLCVMDYTVDEYCESHRARYFAMPLRRFNNSDMVPAKHIEMEDDLSCG